MTCPGCNKEVQGNFCPECKKPLSSGGPIGGAKKPAAAKGAPSQTAHLNRSAAMDQKGSGPKVADKTVDVRAKSATHQANNGTGHLVNQSGFGNTVRDKRWRMADTIALALLAIAAIIGIVGMMMPFFTATLTATGEETPISGMQAISFDFKGHGGMIGTMAMLSMVAFIVVAIISVLKLLAINVKALDFMLNVPVAAAHGVLSILALVFGVMAFTGVTAFIALQDNVGAIPGLIAKFNGGNGLGTLLLLVAGIASAIIGLISVFTELKLVKLKQASAPASSKGAPKGALS